MLRKTCLLFGAGALFVVAPLPAQGQVYLGPTIAFHDDWDFGVGATIEFDLPELSPGLSFMGDFMYYFPDNFDYWEIDTNLTYDFALEGTSAVPFALGGLNIGHVSSDNPQAENDGNTEVGLNLGGGVKFGLGSLRPRIAARFTVFGFDEGFGLFFVLPFQLAN